MGLFDFLKKKEPVQPEVQQPSSAPVNPVSTYPVNFNDQQPVAPVEPTVPTQAPVDNSVNPVISNIGAMPMDSSNTTEQTFSVPVQTPVENISATYSPTPMDMPKPTPPQDAMNGVPTTTTDSAALPTMPSDYTTVTSMPSMDAMPNLSGTPDSVSTDMGSTMTEPSLNTAPMANPNPAPLDTPSVPSNGAY